MRRPQLLTLISASIVVVAALILIPLWLTGVIVWSDPARAREEPAAEAKKEGAAGDQVELTEAKLAAAGVKTDGVVRRPLQSHRMVPGRINYDAPRHVLVKSPFDGLIRTIDVKVGDRVTEGQVMGIVDSPDLGERRSDVMLRQTDLDQATAEHNWWHSIESNVHDLIARLKRPQEVTELEEEFADKPLGDYRQQILGAYAKMRLDEALSNNVKAPAEKGAVSLRTKLEYDAAKDTAVAKFAAVCEQATFDVRQMHLKTESAMLDAERRLAVARQRLALLVNQAPEDLPAVEDKASLSAWPIRAPFTATVEEVLLAPKERIQLADGLIQLADTSKLWVQADIRERDWSALKITPGQTVQVQTPALPGQTLNAKVIIVGRTVSTDTRAVPLIADIDNRDGLLRPGMFVRVLIPDGGTRECVTVPYSAVMGNEGRTFVFVQTGPRTFRAQDIKVGLHVDPWVEIVSGLQLGDQVVTSGGALLKAELLLEPEE